MANDSSKPKRRHFPAAEQARILAEYAAASTPVERAALMRREGVYASLVAYWRRSARGSSAPLAKRGRPEKPESQAIQRLKRENERLKRRAERAEDLVETLGKVHALLQNAVSKSAEEKQQSRKPL